MAASNATDALVNKLHTTFTGGTSTFFDTLQVSLWSNDTSSLTELSGAGYARQSITGGATGWTYTAGTLTHSNTNAVTFPVATAAWQNIHRIRLIHPSTSTIVLDKTLTQPITILGGQQLIFPIGDLTILPNTSSNYSNSLAKKVNDAICGFTALTAPASGMSFHLYTTLPNKDGTGGVEVSGNGYSHNLYAGSWTVAGTNAYNNSIIDWPEPSAPWGTIAGVVVKDNASGNIMFIVDSADVTVTDKRVYIDVANFDFVRVV